MFFRYCFKVLHIMGQGLLHYYSSWYRAKGGIPLWLAVRQCGDLS